MTGTAESIVTTVTSTDDVEIAVFVSGTGRPLVVVPGTTSDHRTWRFVSPLLEPHAAVHAVDRRGRGASGDRLPYSLSKEYDDVAAIVDAAAAAAGMPVDLLGHSFGGNIAFGAALRTANLRKLVLYEGWPVPNLAHRRIDPVLTERLDSLLANGHDELMLETFLRQIVHLSEAELRDLKASPTWPVRVEAARTVPRELRAFADQAFDPAAADKIAVPVLLIVGADSPADIKADPDVVAAALPDARIDVLAGQAHMAHLTDPETFAARVLAFLGD
jgi:pimeloyl-ACP methyl ester carboxylesterase